MVKLRKFRISQSQLFKICCIACLAAFNAFLSNVNPISPCQTKKTPSTVNANLKTAKPIGNTSKNSDPRIRIKQIAARIRKNILSVLARLSPPDTIPIASISNGRFGSHVLTDLSCLNRSSIVNRARNPT
ncbi:hypothetical protein GCK72_003388 [Caenorhabditis remanei]|uniref:Uncharacterized protein n=1 Tax=Caenorhabditis remanei TaxID=31234 RepID=A0A6A5HWB8_CAERE|nr:hypothetical protein GCK72_003388 [Caenorhabditis remanei]KAF1771561.1 hypothetical protein GCK72_003388 [Caenorhabditis remanei]